MFRLLSKHGSRFLRGGQGQFRGVPDGRGASDVCLCCCYFELLSNYSMILKRGELVLTFPLKCSAATHAAPRRLVVFSAASAILGGCMNSITVVPNPKLRLSALPAVQLVC